MAEAILWAKRERPMRRSVAAGNKQVNERLPQNGTFGDYDSPIAAPPRWRRVVDSYGNDLRVVLTNAAADLDTESSYARHQRAKWRKFGWYEIGACPCALFLNKELRSEHFSSPEVLEDAKERRACQPGTYSEKAPCPHALAEMKARRAQNAAELAERLKSFQSEADKAAVIHAAQNKELLAGLAGVMAGAIKDTAAAVAQATAPKDPPGPPAPAKGSKG